MRSYYFYRAIVWLKKKKNALYKFSAVHKWGTTEALQNYISSQAPLKFSLKLKGKSKESMKSREPQ